MSDSKENIVSEDYEESKRLLQTIVDYAWNKYHKQHEHFDRLDQKATTLAGFIGVILTIVTAFANTILNISIYSQNCILYHILMLKLLLLIIILLLILSFYLSINAIRVRSLTDPSSIEELLNYNLKLMTIKNIHKRHKQLLVGITKTLSRAEKSISLSNSKKSFLIKKVTLLLIIAVFLGLSEILLFFFYTLTAIK